MQLYLERPWGRMAYDDLWGTRPALLFLHGTGCDRQDWAETIASLRKLVPAEAFPRSIALEFRGHGASQVPEGRFSLSDLAQDVVALLNHLALEQVVLVGHSLGGMVAMEAARLEQDAGQTRLAGLLLLEGWTNLRVAYEGFDPGRMHVGLADDQAAAVRSKADSTRARFERGDWDAFWETVVAFDGSAYLVQSRIPIRQVYGTWGHRGGSLGVPERGNIGWYWIMGAGHYLPLVAPGEVARICAEFICSLREFGV